MDCGAWLCFFVLDFLQQHVSTSQILTENDIKGILERFTRDSPQEIKAMEMRSAMARELDK